MALQVRREYDFKWVGRDRSGKRVEGLQRAASPSEVRSLIVQQGIQPISVDRAKRKATKGGKVNSGDIMVFARQMATMMGAGIPISEALGMQASGMTKLSMRELLLAIRADVDRGEGFAGALNKHPEIFSSMFRGLVHAGEESGTLQRVFEQLAIFLEKTEGIKKAIKKALVYPIAVITIALIITFIILWKVVPVFEDLFASSGAALPGPTQVVVNISEFVQSKNFVFLLLALVAIGWGIRQAIKRSYTLRYRVHEMSLKIPIVGDLISLQNSAVFARTLATMYDAGTPMISSLQTVANSAGNLLFKEAILKMRDDVSIGQELNFAMKQSNLFPEMVVHMVGIGEKAGDLSAMLMSVAEQYEEDIDGTVAALMSLIEPFLIVFLGVIIGGIIIAMYLPLFSMGDMF